MKPQVDKNSKRPPGLRLALLSGLLLWLACPPVGLFPAAWAAVAPLILSITRAERFRQAAWRGYLFGWVYLGLTWYWAGLTIVGWTGSNIGWLAWAALTFLLAGFYAAWGGCAWWITRRTHDGWRIVALAASWALLEWARTLGTISMPWAELSRTQYRFPTILQAADITGAYGISFLILLVNASIADWLPKRGQANAGRWAWLSLTLTGLLLLYGLGRLSAPETGPELRVAALQGNFSVRPTHDEVEASYGTIEKMTRSASETSPPPELYVWSESAAPRDALGNQSTRNLFAGLAQSTGAPVMVGSHVSEPNRETNSSLLFLPDGSAPMRYDKQQLVPFGEFVPFRKQIPATINTAFQIFDDDLSVGTNPSPFRFTGGKGRSVALGPFICYESVYPAYARGMTRMGADLLVSQSNDAWFNSRAAMEQHLSAIVLRAIENRREVVRSTTNGITCFVDSRGRVIDRAPLETQAYRVRTMHLLNGMTLYTRFGDWFIGLCAMLIVIAVIRCRARPAEAKPPSSDR